jgi:hypothetical protein
LFVCGGRRSWALGLFLSRYLDLIRHGPRGRRIEVARKVRRLCERDEPAGAAIGAIELPPRKNALIPFALDLLRQPFEITGKSAQRARRAIYESFAKLLPGDD